MAKNIRVTLALASSLSFLVLIYWWPWLVNYSVPEYYQWLTVIDKLPLRMGQTIAGIAAIGAPWALWPKNRCEEMPRGSRTDMSYGLEYHFQTMTNEKGVVVFNHIDECIYGRFLFNDCSFNPNLSGRRILAERDALQLMHRLNGSPAVDIAGIDGTP